MPPCEGVHGPCATMARSQIMLRKGVPMSIDRSPYARVASTTAPFPEHLRRLNLSVGVVEYLKDGVPKDEIARQLTRTGMSLVEAAAFVESRDQNRRGKSKGRSGLPWWVGGGLIVWGLAIFAPRAILGASLGGADIVAGCLVAAGTVALVNALRQGKSD